MKYQMTFYGTGAAAAIPNPFCRCPICAHARQTGGKDRRRRAFFRVNEAICVDFGPDVSSQSTALGDLWGLEHVLVTHTHPDHLDHGSLEVWALATESRGRPLRLYFAGEAFQMVKRWREEPGFLGNRLARYEKIGAVIFHSLSFGEETKIGGARVTPYRGNHHGNLGERSANYLLELPDGSSLYYACDTGYFLEETFQALAWRKNPIDRLVLECNDGPTLDRGERPDFHLNLLGCRGVVERLLLDGAITEKTICYLTHFAHQHATHAQLEVAALAMNFPCRTVIAYDGLEMEPLPEL